LLPGSREGFDHTASEQVSTRQYSDRGTETSVTKELRAHSRVARLPTWCIWRFTGSVNSGRGSTRKNVAENDGLVRQLVASRKDERERILSRDRPKLAEEFDFIGELSLVSSAELDPSARVMPEPSTVELRYTPIALASS
jgi:hypothetical protein